MLASRHRRRSNSWSFFEVPRHVEPVALGLEAEPAARTGSEAASEPWVPPDDPAAEKHFNQMLDELLAAYSLEDQVYVESYIAAFKSSVKQIRSMTDRIAAETHFRTAVGEFRRKMAPYNHGCRYYIQSACIIAACTLLGFSLGLLLTPIGASVGAEVGYQVGLAAAGFVVGLFSNSTRKHSDTAQGKERLKTAITAGATYARCS